MTKPDRIYFDNAATSWPKPEAVYQAVDDYQRRLGAPAGRAAYADALEVENLISGTRRALAQLIHAPQAEHIVFTCNGTDALNMALLGYVRPGDHVVTSVVEHNSVLRPLRFLRESRDVMVSYVECDIPGTVDPEDIRRALRPQTRLIALSHASNVTGALQPVEAISQIAREAGVALLVDAAQSIGHVEWDVRQVPVDFLAASGHKGLLGPLGTGFLYLRPEMAKDVLPSRFGGTGTQSENDTQPDALPHKFESGNLNVPGIVGLGAGVRFIAERGIDSLRQHEQALTAQLVEGLSEISGIQVYGPPHSEQRVGVTSFSVEGIEPQEMAILLDSAARIQVRSGLHCAPRMHEALGTIARGGTVRVSTGPFNTARQITTLLECLQELFAARNVST